MMYLQKQFLRFFFFNTHSSHSLACMNHLLKSRVWDFLGGPLVKNQGNEDPTCHAAWPKGKCRLWSSGSGRGLWVCIFHMLPGDTNPAGPFWWTKRCCSQLCLACNTHPIHFMSHHVLVVLKLRQCGRYPWPLVSLRALTDCQHMTIWACMDRHHWGGIIVLAGMIFMFSDSSGILLTLIQIN